MNLDDLKIVLVKWDDASSTSDNISLKSAEGLAPVPRVNVGYIIYEDDKLVKICCGFYLEGDSIREADHTLIILKGMITSLKYLNEDKSS